MGRGQGTDVLGSAYCGYNQCINSGATATGETVEVGIRDLRDHLSRYIEAVRTGDELIVTDHGTAVARIVPLVETRRIDQLIAEGVVSPAASRARHRPRQRAKATASVSELVADQRR